MLKISLLQLPGIFDFVVFLGSRSEGRRNEMFLVESPQTAVDILFINHPRARAGPRRPWGGAIIIIILNDNKTNIYTGFTLQHDFNKIY